MRLLVALLCLLAGGAQAETRIPANYPEGLYFDANSDLYYAELATGRIYRHSSDGLQVFWVNEGCGPSGFTRVSDTAFAIACHVGRSVVIVDQTGAELAQVTHDRNGRMFRSPNDITADGNGGAVFSDSGTFWPDAPAEGVVYHLRPDLTATPIETGLHYPNGVALDPTREIVVVSEHLKRRIITLDLTGHRAPEPLIDFATHPATEHLMLGFAGPDGVRRTPDGALVIALYGTGRVARLDLCGELTVTRVQNRYVTSVAIGPSRMAIASAESNVGPDFGGEVLITDLLPDAGCD